MASKPVLLEVEDFHGIVGNSRPIRELRTTIEAISNNNATVLIQGETGTGKELVARAVHKLSARSKSPFIALDCGAIAESLMESELFGSKRGSFTGAFDDRPGVFEAAHQGTLFLDEISNMNLSMQSKLLRVLQEREVRRIGETRSRPIDVRLIAASNANLQHLVAEGSFRQDLLFRLNVIGVHIPPLRQRREGHWHSCGTFSESIEPRAQVQ
jgi:transcriptional regulator with PAS, ATPase and Fis domain